MASELSPGGGKARMTKAQVKIYVKNMKAQQEKAKKKLAEAKANGELDETEELAKLEEKMDDVF